MGLNISPNVERMKRQRQMKQIRPSNDREEWNDKQESEQQQNSQTFNRMLYVTMEIYMFYIINVCNTIAIIRLQHNVVSCCCYPNAMQGRE